MKVVQITDTEWAIYLNGAEKQKLHDLIDWLHIPLTNEIRADGLEKSECLKDA